MSDQTKAYLLALLAVFFWSTSASAFKITLRHFDVMQMLLVSSLISLIVMGTLLVFQGRLKKAFQGGKRSFAWSIVLGFLNPFLYYVVLLKAYDMLPAQEAQALNYTWSIVLILFSIPLLKQGVTLLTFFSVSISYFGVVVIATHGHLLSLNFAYPSGVFLALGSTIVWALFWIFNLRDQRDEEIKLFLNFLFGFFLILALCLLTDDLPTTNMKGLLGSVYIGVLEMGITYIIWLKALKNSSSTDRIASLIYLSPFISLVWIRLFVGERILYSTIVGLLFIIAGILFQNYFHKKRPHSER